MNKEIPKEILEWLPEFHTDKYDYCMGTILEETIRGDFEYWDGDIWRATPDNCGCDVIHRKPKTYTHPA